MATHSSIITYAYHLMPTCYFVSTPHPSFLVFRNATLAQLLTQSQREHPLTHDPVFTALHSSPPPTLPPLQFYRLALNSLCPTELPVGIYRCQHPWPHVLHSWQQLCPHLGIKLVCFLPAYRWYLVPRTSEEAAVGRSALQGRKDKAR